MHHIAKGVLGIEYFCNGHYYSNMSTTQFILEIKNDIFDIVANMKGIIDVLIINKGAFDSLPRSLIIPNLIYTSYST